MNNIKRISLLITSITLSLFCFSQKVNDGTESTGQDLSKEYNVITTAVPFLTITPDSRSGGMGDVGAATTADVWSQNWNASKYALAKKDLSVGLSYTPWLENLGLKDINLIYVAGYKKIASKQAVGASMRYFSLGSIQAYDETGDPIAGEELNPKEYAFDVSYSRYLADNFVMGMTGRFIYSNLGGDYDPDYKPGKAGAADISGTYFTSVSIQGVPSDIQVGFNISNIGNKITYSANQKDFLPTNLRVGAGLNSKIDEYNKVSVYVDLNKLLVPTPDTASDNDSKSVTEGIFTSFTDAPGGYKEELKEITISSGVEYWYNDQFALRGGYFNEAKTKGNRKYFTVGLGLRLNVFGLDFAYLVPVAGTNSPLANTFRFSLTFDFDGLASENKAKNDKL